MVSVEEIQEKTTDGNKKPDGNKKDIQRRSALDIKQMFGNDGKDKRYQIIKRIRSCYLHKDVRTSIYFTTRVQMKTKDLQPD